MQEILFIIGLIGFGLASYYDLKTSEFSGAIPYVMIISALAINVLLSILEKDFFIITKSVIFGCVMLALGMVLYKYGKWQDGDAWLLGSLCFMFPDMLVLVSFSIGTLAYCILYKLFFVNKHIRFAPAFLISLFIYLVLQVLL